MKKSKALLLVMVFLLLLFATGKLWWDNHILKGEVYTMSVYAGTIQASVDYDCNILRIYTLNSDEDRRFTGVTEGPFEIWNWPSLKGSRYSSSVYVEAYNRKIKKLYQEEIQKNEMGLDPGDNRGG
ncbi:MAG: hypothetical protein ABFD91_05340 [Anaerohalosphaeraceae bacterium]